MSNTEHKKDLETDAEDVIAARNDIEPTMAMMSTLMEDIAVHIYGIDCHTCNWGVINEQDHPGFQFEFEDNDDNHIRFDRMVDDFMSVPSPIEKHIDKAEKVIGFTSVENIISFLEHLSIYKNWGMTVPLEEYVYGLPIDAENNAILNGLQELPDTSVMFLRKDGYAGMKACLPELKAAFIAAQNNLPIVKFTYTLEEIRKSLTAYDIKQCGARTYDPQTVLWFH